LRRSRSINLLGTEMVTFAFCEKCFPGLCNCDRICQNCTHFIPDYPHEIITGACGLTMEMMRGDEGVKCDGFEYQYDPVPNAKVSEGENGK